MELIEKKCEIMLSVVIGTYNRKELLRKCINSIINNNKTQIKVFITDAGSNDGTIEYLKSIASKNIKPLFIGKKIGQAKAYNDVFDGIETPFVCWLSDDNVVINKSLDIAVKILKNDNSIGMVGLKTKDVEGPFVYAPYIGGISSIGILNVNQGVLPTKLLKKLGGFSEEFRDYGIDPDLTAKVLFSNHKVVYTKKVALLHHRGWDMNKDTRAYKELRIKQLRSLELYNRKYRHLEKPKSSSKKFLGLITKKINEKQEIVNIVKNKRMFRDWNNILKGKYISILDPIYSQNKDYHLIQKA